MQERYKTGVYRNVPMVEGMECAEHPLADAAYEHFTLEASRLTGVYRAIAVENAVRAWNERADVRSIDAPCALAIPLPASTTP